MTPPLNTRWFRRWWFLVPVAVSFVLVANINVVLSFPIFVLYMAIMWSGPIYRLGKPAPKVLKIWEKLFITGISIALMMFALVRQGSAAPTSNSTTGFDGLTSNDELETPAGLLHVIEEVENTKIVRLGEQSLFKSDAYSISFQPLHSPTNSGLILVFLNSSGPACPGFFRLIDIGVRPPHVTDDFGSCSDTPAIRWRESTIILQFPGVSDSSEWRYTRSSGLIEIGAKTVAPPNQQSETPRSGSGVSPAISASAELECLSMVAQVIYAETRGLTTGQIEDRLLDDKIATEVGCAAIAKCDSLGPFELAAFVRQQSARGGDQPLNCQPTRAYRSPDPVLSEFPRIQESIKNIVQYHRPK